jgi:hypothetical protein
MNKKKKKRRKLIFQLSLTNKYYMYERFKNYPSPEFNKRGVNKNLMNDLDI